MLKLKLKENPAYILIAVFAAFWCALLTLKYFAFAYFDWDLAFFNQSMWNLLHGSQFSSLFNRNFLGNHANLIAFIFLPLYAFFPHALFLVYIKALALALAAWPIFLVAGEELNKKYGLLIVLLYFLYAPLNYALSYEFDWENLAASALPWLFYFYYKKRFRGFCILALLTLAIKENLPLVLIMFGLHGLFSRREKRWWLFSWIAGGLWFYFTVFRIVPYFHSSRNHGHWYYYSVLNQGPIAIVRFLFDGQNLNFLFKLFSPLAFIPLLRPDILLLALPLFLQHMLSSQWTEHTIYYNYASSLIPFIFLALIFSLKPLLKRKRLARFMIPVLIICSLVTGREVLPMMSSTFSNARHAFGPARWELVRMVPKEASVVATSAFLSELSGRKELYAFIDVISQAHYDGLRPMPDMEYALVDFNDPYLKNELASGPSNHEKIDSFLRQRHFKLIAAKNNISLFRKINAED